jgi:AraC-like DNA-binding protein
MDYFTQLFRALVGVSPKSWLLQQKLKRGATMLLESSESISSLSDVLGFSDIYHFSRCFKTQYGLSPKAWRNKKAQ